MENRKRSTRLINIIFFIFLLSFILLVLVQYRHLEKNTRASFQNSIDVLTSSLEDRIETIDKLYYTYEQSIDSSLYDKLLQLSKFYRDGNLDQSQLFQLKDNNPYIDLYVIDNTNHVVMTTYEPDLYLDFNQFTDFPEYLDYIRSSDDYITERVSLSTATSEMKKYSYLTTPDNQFILEASYEMGEYEEFMGKDSFKNFSSEVIRHNENIIDLKIYNYFGNNFSKESTIFDNENQDKITAFKTAQQGNFLTTFTQNTGQYEVITKYIPYTIKNFNNHENIYIMELTYSTELINASLRSWITQQGIILIIILLFMIILLLYYNYFVLNPINNMLKAFDEVSKSNFSVRLPLQGDQELKDASRAFNDMSESIETLIDDIELNENNLIEVLNKVEKGYFETVRALANSIDAKDNYTSTHCEHVMELSVLVAEHLDLSSESIQTIMYGSLLHDIGKIGIADNILNKKGRFTSSEYEEIKAHPLIGFNIVKNIEFLDSASEIILSHHESIDGTGYPNALKGDQIPYLAKIITITDAFDAMTSQRVYKKNVMTVNDAFDELKKCSNTQFDGPLVTVFIEAYINKFGDDLDYIADVIELRK